MTLKCDRKGHWNEGVSLHIEIWPFSLIFHISYFTMQKAVKQLQDFFSISELFIVFILIVSNNSRFIPREAKYNGKVKYTIVMFVWTNIV